MTLIVFSLYLFLPFCFKIVDFLKSQASYSCIATQFSKFQSQDPLG